MKTIRVRADEKGVILVALLWILVALSVMAISFARESFVEVAAARNARDLADAYYIARAGISATVYQLWQKRSTPRVKQLELQAMPDPIDLGRITGEFGSGYYEVEIQDETARIDLNSAPEEQLRRLMEIVGIEKPDADVIVDSLLDWRDVDNAHRINGAEDDYYQTLDPPYLAKNNRFDTVEELLLVRGVTKDYFYGFQERGDDGAAVYRYGLSRYFTTFSRSPRLNVNYAPLTVLLSVPGMPLETAQYIVGRRQSQPFESVEEITREAPVKLATESMPFLSTAQTGIYTLTASGRRANSKVRRVIRAVVALDLRAPNRYRIEYWNENVPNL